MCAFKQALCVTYEGKISFEVYGTGENKCTKHKSCGIQMVRYMVYRQRTQEGYAEKEERMLCVSPEQEGWKKREEKCISRRKEEKVVQASKGRNLLINCQSVNMGGEWQVVECQPHGSWIAEDGEWMGVVSDAETHLVYVLHAGLAPSH